MKLNAALGELIGQYRDNPHRILHFLRRLFRHPVPDRGRWGDGSCGGHHLDVHCFVLGRQLVAHPDLHGWRRPAEGGPGVRTRGCGLFDAQREAGARTAPQPAPRTGGGLAVLYESMRLQEPPAPISRARGERQALWGGAGPGQPRHWIRRTASREGLTLPQAGPCCSHLVEDLPSDRLPRGPRRRVG